jgi:hypothetical protein
MAYEQKFLKELAYDFFYKLIKFHYFIKSLPPLLAAIEGGINFNIFEFCFCLPNKINEFLQLQIGQIIHFEFSLISVETASLIH